MKNLTITVDDSVLEWARIEAARRGASVSRMVGDFMAEMQRREDAYERAYLAWRTDERSWRAQSAAPAEPAAAVATAAPAPLPRDATVLVDTGVLVLAEDTSAGHGHLQTLACLDHLWRERTGRVSTQGLSEFYESVTGHADRPMPQGDARAAIRRYNSWTPCNTTPPRWTPLGRCRRATPWLGATVWRWRPRSTAVARRCCRCTCPAARSTAACRSSTRTACALPTEICPCFDRVTAL